MTIITVPLRDDVCTFMVIPDEFFLE